MGRILLWVMTLLVPGLLLVSASAAPAQECQNQEIIDAYLFGCGATGAVCEATCMGLTTVCDHVCGAAEATCRGACTVSGKTCEALCDIGTEIACQSACIADDTQCRTRCAGQCTRECVGSCLNPVSRKCRDCVSDCSTSCNAACTTALRSCSAACTSNPACNQCLDCRSDCKLNCDNCHDLECEKCQLDCEAKAPECVPFKQVGEVCWPDPGGLWLGQCAEDLSCGPVIEGRDIEDTDFKLSDAKVAVQCVPPKSETIYPRELCMALYNPIFHESWAKVGQGLAKTWGVGGNETLGVSLVGETGVVYGQKCYGCYQAYCSGFSTNVAIAAYRNSGLYYDFDSVAGQSYAVVGALGIPLPGEFLEVSAAWVFGAGTNDYLGLVTAGAVTAGLLPVEGGVLWCDTVVQPACCIDEEAEPSLGGRCAQLPKSGGGGGGGGNQPPVALCSNTNECAPAGTCEIPLVVGPDSYDPEGGNLTRVQTPPSPYPVGQHAVLLRVTDPEGLSSICTASVEVRDCEPPSLTCPSPAVAECQGDRKATVDPGDAAAADACSTPSVTDPGPGIFGLGETVVGYTATDASGNETSCKTTVTVRDTIPPALTCPAPQTVECAANGQAPITFTASAADACWGETVAACVPASGSSLPLGDTMVNCTSEDGSGNSAACDVAMTVVDTTPPDILEVTAKPDLLWPPNHKMKKIKVGMEATDACDPEPTCRVIGVTSDEPDHEDAELLGPNTLKLRAERDGEGDGRVYTITVECRDATGGNATRRTTTVTVPHDLGKGEK